VLASCPDEGFVVEEFLPGRGTADESVAADMVSVEMIVDGPLTHHVATTGRFRLAPPFRETGSFMPSDLDDSDATSAVAQASAAARALGVNQGALHIEFKLTPKGPRIIEVNGRVGGGIPWLLARLGGTQIIRCAMRLALSLPPGPVAALPSAPVAFFYWAPAPPTAGRLKAVEGMDRVSQLPGVDQVTLNRQIGDALDPRLGLESRVLTVEGTAPTHADLWRLIPDIQSTLSVRVE
jgi:biotin carboxylase